MLKDKKNEKKFVQFVFYTTMLEAFLLVLVSSEMAQIGPVAILLFNKKYYFLYYIMRVLKKSG